MRLYPRGRGMILNHSVAEPVLAVVPDVLEGVERLATILLAGDNPYDTPCSQTAMSARLMRSETASMVRSKRRPRLRVDGWGGGTTGGAGLGATSSISGVGSLGWTAIRGVRSCR